MGPEGMKREVTRARRIALAPALSSTIVKRRHLVLAPLAVTGALAVGWGLLPMRQRLTTADPLPSKPGTHAFNGWVRVGEDDRAWLVCPKTEMGQGVHTGLAILLAEELGIGLDRVGISAAPVDAIYGNVTTVVDSLAFLPDDESVLRRVTSHLVGKLMREAAPMLTGGSSSLKDLWGPLRLAAAATRQMLVAEAAARWGVPEATVSVAEGRLQHPPSGRSLRFGEVAAAAAARPLPRDVVVTAPAQWRLIGRPQPHLHAAAKVSGGARFGIDVRESGQKYAAVALAPTLTGAVREIDPASEQATKALPGVRAVVRFDPPAAGGPGGVAVIADSTWQAMQAVQALKIRWDDGAAAGADSAALMKRLEQALGPDSTDTPFPYLDRGDVESALAGAATRIEATYQAPFMAHQALEPINATVWVGDGRATLWAPTQSPDLAQAVVARVLGLPLQAVTVNVTLAGGGFGRRLDVDYVEQAALIARALPGVPVQTLWTRAQDTQHDFYRPACVSRLRAGFDAQRRLVAWDHHAAGPLLAPAVMGRYGSAVTVVPTVAKSLDLTARLLRPLGALPVVALDKLSAEGGFDPAYAWPHARMRHTPIETAIPVGFWRSVGHSHMGFITEGFVNECAHAAGADPVAFRRALLAAQPRHRAVLDAAAQAANWGQPSPPAADGAPTARGVALHASFGSVVAMVAEVSVAGAGSTRRIRVHRVFSAIDCGVAVNPNLVRQQMEGAVVFALTAALHGGVRVEQGRVTQAHFIDLPLLRLPEAPQVEVVILPSTIEHPEGVGEPGVPPLAPAVAAAVFTLTGTRLRALPLVLPATA
jgi:isoquinoline 1-oxidoreductase subunit beta